MITSPETVATSSWRLDAATALLLSFYFNCRHSTRLRGHKLSTGDGPVGGFSGMNGGGREKRERSAGDQLSRRWERMGDFEWRESEAHDELPLI